MLVPGAVDLRRIPLGVLGPEGLVLALPVVIDHRRGQREDAPGRAIILLELHHPCARIVLLEVEDVPDVRAAPAVNTLVRISDDAHVPVLAGQEPDDPVLGAVRVLVLVDEDVAPEAAIPGDRLGDLFVKLHRLEEKVVEVHRADRAQSILVPAEDERDLLLPRPARPLPGRVHAHHVVLPVADALGDRAGRGGAIGEVHLLHALLDQALAVVLVVDHEMRRQPDVPPVLAEDPDARRVERRDERRLQPDRQQQRFDPAGHLAGGLVGERDGEQVPRRDALLAREPGDPVRDDARLAASGAGEDEERPVAGGDGLALRGIQIVEEARELGRHRSIVPGDRGLANTKPGGGVAHRPAGARATRP